MSTPKYLKQSDVWMGSLPSVTLHYIFGFSFTYLNVNTFSIAIGLFCNKTCIEIGIEALFSVLVLYSLQSLLSSTAA